MAGRYLLPEDLSAEHARQVLAAVNEAASAAELAAAVEIRNELDVGLRVAARILARRDELGGFTGLDQIYAVPYVGPERFTELVTSLSGARPPPDRPAAAAAADGRVQARLDALEALLGDGASLELKVIGDEPWLGQESVLMVKARDARGRPLVDRRLTLVTTWGRLRGREGVRPVSGNAVVVRSDHLGLARVRLGASMGEALSEVEAASLGTALARLGTGSNSPRDSLDALMDLARSYRAAGNDGLRRAVDVHYRRHGEAAQGDVPGDLLAAWPQLAATVVAYLTPEPDSASTRPATTLVTVRQRNWLYAFALAFRSLLESESALAGSLGDVAGDGRSSAGVLSDVFARVGSFLKAQDGWVGQVVGQGFARNSLNQFLQTQLAKFPPAERSAVLTGVAAGSRSLSGGRELLAATELSRSDVGARLANVDRAAEVAALDDRMGVLESTATEVAVLNQRLGELENRNAALGRSVSTLEARDAQLQRDLTALGRDLTRADERLQAVAARNAQVDERLQVLDADSRRMDARITALDSDRVRLDSEIQAVAVRNTRLADQIGTLNARNDALGRDLNTVSTRLTGVDRDVAQLKNRR